MLGIEYGEKIAREGLGLGLNAFGFSLKNIITCSPFVISNILCSNCNLIACFFSLIKGAYNNIHFVI